MRIIGGKNQRKQIFAPVKLPVRPTTDMAKEALFNILNNHFDFESITVLDLFSGTGNIAYEFSSRGAKEVVAVDINHACVRFIKKTGDELCMENLKAVKAETFHFLKFCNISFDILFADPPYDFDQIQQLPEKIFDAAILNDDGWVIIEHNEKVDFSTHPCFLESRKYGKVHFSFFQKCN